MWSAWTLALALTAASPPDIVLVTVDTLRGDMPGFAGGPAHTPTLDALAAASWTFSRCYAAAMLTNPSHASLMTSRYPRDHGVYDNDSGIADATPTLTRALRAAGYHTGAVLNFRHLNPEVVNLGHGMQRVVLARARERSAQEVTARGLALLALLPRPAFLWLHYTEPHAPYEPAAGAQLRPERFAALPSMAEVARRAPRFQRANPWFATHFARGTPAAQVAARYVAEVEQVDAALAALRAGLAAQGRADAVLAVTSDHGENLGENALFFHHGGLYDSAVHVPLIVHVPGSPAARHDGLVSGVDVAPTLLALAQVAPLPGSRGVDLAAVIGGGVAAHKLVFSEHMFGQQVAVRALDATLIVHRRNSGQFPSYPMRAGRRELMPAALAPARVAQLDAALELFLEPGAAALTKPAPASNREALRSLGYVD